MKKRERSKSGKMCESRGKGLLGGGGGGGGGDQDTLLRKFQCETRVHFLAFSRQTPVNVKHLQKGPV